MTAALVFVLVGYPIVGALISWRLWTHVAPPPVPDAALPRVAVVVAARDEEASLGRCLEALRAQDYPADRLTIVVADDHSTDGTAALVHRMAGEAGLPIRYVRVPDPQGSLRGKAQALHTAFEAVDAEGYLLTDADCAPVPTWARTLASAFADERIGIICGLPRLEERPGHPADAVQALDWEYLVGMVSSADEAGFPATGIGNNMGVRAEAYDRVGGYPALPFSITEDFVLVRAVTQAGWTVRFPMDPGSLVLSHPADDLAEAFGQRRRWARGGLGDNAWVLPVYVFVFAVHAVLLAGLVLEPALGAMALASMTAGVAMVAGSVRRRVGGRVRLGALLGTVLFQLLYFVTLPAVLVLRPEITWKGRQH